MHVDYSKVYACYVVEIFKNTCTPLKISNSGARTRCAGVGSAYGLYTGNVFLKSVYHVYIVRKVFRKCRISNLSGWRESSTVRNPSEFAGVRVGGEGADRGMWTPFKFFFRSFWTQVENYTLIMLYWFKNECTLLPPLLHFTSNRSEYVDLAWWGREPD